MICVHEAGGKVYLSRFAYFHLKYFRFVPPFLPLKVVTFLMTNDLSDKQHDNKYEKKEVELIKSNTEIRVNFYFVV